VKRMIIAGNWKMHTTPSDAGSLALTIAAADAVGPFTRNGGVVVICPPYLSVPVVAARLQPTSVLVGGQNCHWEASGAYTGEVSASMLADAGCRYVILGHSERRRDQLEDDAMIGHKAVAAAAAGLTPIVCVGESLAEREAGVTVDVVTHQIDGVVAASGVDTMRRSILAYEPIWAIGTGLAATPEQAQEVHAAVRSHCRSRHGIDVPILYGGSVTDQNADDLFAQPDINGALVGGASLKAAAFNEIIRAATPYVQ